MANEESGSQEIDLDRIVFSRDAQDREGFWQLDRNLPRWARRSNPVVRRHLGGFLGAPIPEMGLLVRAVVIQQIVVLVSFLIPATLELVALLGLVSFIVLPITLSAYAGALYMIGHTAASAIMEEREAHALDTLRTTPLSLRTILLSKIASSLWRQAVNLDTVLLATAFASLPVITIQQATLYPPDKYPFEGRLLIIAGLAASVARVILEPLMVGALGVLVGSLAQMRLAAQTWATLLTAAYFVLVNLPRLGWLPWHQRLIIETVLPVLLPAIITLGAMRLAQRFLQRE